MRDSQVADDQVIVVDENDVPTGTLRKLEAHAEGVLHRAVSVLLRRADGAVLLQQRAPTKYHSPGLWSNTCCGHPRPGESAHAAARRRLGEEMGLDAALVPAGTLRYRADVGGGLIEHEIDHLFAGSSEQEPAPNPAEVSACRWVPLDELLADLEANPARYTAWCGLVVRAVVAAGAAGAAQSPTPAR